MMTQDGIASFKQEKSGDHHSFKILVEALQKLFDQSLFYHVGPLIYWRRALVISVVRLSIRLPGLFSHNKSLLFLIFYNLHFNR